MRPNGCGGSWSSHAPRMPNLTVRRGTTDLSPCLLARMVNLLSLPWGPLLSLPRAPCPTECSVDRQVCLCRRLTRVSINRGEGGGLLQIDLIPSKKRDFLPPLYCSPPIMGQTDNTLSSRTGLSWIILDIINTLTILIRNRLQIP